jgi:psp operon transcriptional activator
MKDHILKERILKERIRPQTARKTTEALGQSEQFLEFQEKLAKVAPIDRPVFLLGERGTGKELAASRLHFLSNRWQGPFVALNCSALAPSLIESELFGYEKGAFTGAVQGRVGRFEAAEGGTLFLDEIGTIPMEVQEKILRVVEYGQLERVGSSKNIEVDVRIIAATNQNPAEMVSQGYFKNDLLDRLSFEVLFLPPLRERQGDILLLANHFASRMVYELGKEEIPVFSKEAVHALLDYSWPGNIRELKNVVERAVYRSGQPVIDEIDFNPFQSPYQKHPIQEKNQVNAHIMGEAHTMGRAHEMGGVYKAEADSALSLDDLMAKPLSESVETLKVFLIQNALKQTKYNQRAAAKFLGLTYHQFRGLYRKYFERLE